jgi:hypothetical protein
MNIDFDRLAREERAPLLLDPGSSLAASSEVSREFIVDLEDRSRPKAPLGGRWIAIMAGLTMSADVPWIGVFTESPANAAPAFGEWVGHGTTPLRVWTSGLCAVSSGR